MDVRSRGRRKPVPRQSSRKSTPSQAGSFAYEGLDRVLHEKARLGILTALLVQSEGCLFQDLKELCSLTDGNLSRHLQVLHDAGLVQVWKSTTESRPKTLLQLTEKGRAEFQSYLEELEQVIRKAKSAPEGEDESRGYDTPPGFAPT